MPEDSFTAYSYDLLLDLIRKIVSGAEDDDEP